ncbi:hypothetical protein QBC46DRAFT_103035 [Diplogelasinospora grovesii]|uniref:Uncharacterized protein n=1 Tax=Diplogelasinospora grovesii TaxID=303347 RepID=A0AAN6RXR6_9PEZI|nr:hypothetical protein QBC46DRAFT_103035 [Diplogelasinospora grovesii]
MPSGLNRYGRLGLLTFKMNEAYRNSSPFRIWKALHNRSSMFAKQLQEGRVVYGQCRPADPCNHAESTSFNGPSPDLLAILVCGVLVTPSRSRRDRGRGKRIIDQCGPVERLNHARRFVEITPRWRRMVETTIYVDLRCMSAAASSQFRLLDSNGTGVMEPRYFGSGKGWYICRSLNQLGSETQVGRYKNALLSSSRTPPPQSCLVVLCAIVGVDALTTLSTTQSIARSAATIARNTRNRGINHSPTLSRNRFAALNNLATPCLACRLFNHIVI